jgi:hypothetical protein
MDIQAILGILHAERERLNQAIGALEAIAGSASKRRGRPPKWLAAIEDKKSGPKPGRKRVLSEEARKRIAEAQKKRWAAAKQAKQ